MPFCPRCRDEFQDWVKKCPDCVEELVKEIPGPPPSGYLAKPEKLVTIATFSFPLEAYLNQAKLESEGIPSFIFDDYIVTANLFYSIAVGGVKLKVKESDVKEANSIIQSVKEGKEKIGPIEETCPKCHSSDIQYQTFRIRPILLLSLLFFPISGDVGFTIPILKNKWKCHSCGFEWKTEEKTDPSPVSSMGAG